MTAPQGDGGAVASEAEVEAALDVWFTRPDWREVYADGPPVRDYMRRAIGAAATARPAPAGEAADQYTLHRVLAPRFSRLLSIARRMRADLELAQSIAGGEITEQEWRSQAEIDRLTRALTTAEVALAQARAENERLRQGKDRFKAGVRAAVTWLHARAQTMADPKAQAVLNSAATNLGWGLAAARVQVGNPITGGHHVLDADTGRTVATRRDGPSPDPARLGTDGEVGDGQG